jgi:hypothetical protein
MSQKKRRRAPSVHRPPSGLPARVDAAALAAAFAYGVRLVADQSELDKAMILFHLRTPRFIADPLGVCGPQDFAEGPHELRWLVECLVDVRCVAADMGLDQQELVAALEEPALWDWDA